MNTLVSPTRNPTASKRTSASRTESSCGEYPEGWFELFGSLKDAPLEIPPELKWEYDAPRETA
jgi:hypothetical protein